MTSRVRRGLARRGVCPVVLITLGLVVCGGAAASKPQPGDVSDQAPAYHYPAPAHADRRITIHGQTLKYRVSIEALPVRNDKHRVIGRVVVTSYLLLHAGNRPVTFAVNGGPGSASAFLNLGAIGPRHVTFGHDDTSPSAPIAPRVNQATWLGFTDLVFIDPIGTGYSRPLVSAKRAKKVFYNPEADVHYLSRVIRDWLVDHDRLRSRKYLVGESYGGFRAPRIDRDLQTRLGIGLNGLVLVSPYLSPTLRKNPRVSPMQWVVTMPSIAAAHLERQGRLTRARMDKIIDYDETGYVSALLRGRSDPAGRQTMYSRLARLTGLDRDYVRRSRGRIDPGDYLRHVYRGEGRIGSFYDANTTARDPFPGAPDNEAGDPISDAAGAKLSASMEYLVRDVIGWKPVVRYVGFNDAITMDKAWGFDKTLRAGSIDALRKAVASDPALDVLIAHGWNDLVCPFMGSRIAIDQMPRMGARIKLVEYPGGHMFYARRASRAAFARDARALYKSR